MLHRAFVLFLSPALAAAALYPTSPANNTVFRPGMSQMSLIRWMDDSALPPANQLGNMRIELMLANTVVATLGTNIPSSRREFKTHMPWGLGPDGSDYAIVFIPPVPFLPIYSARFTISNQTSADTTSHAASFPNSTTTASLSARQAVATSPAAHWSLSSSSAAVPTSMFDPSGEKIGTTENGSHRMRIESSVRFRAFYVLWPALVGAALAS